MGNSWFRFQQFTVHQDRSGMKISTDAVMLGALATATSPRRILDIGTGTGVIALMLAQRFPNAQIEAIEIDEQAAEQAAENISASPFASRMNLIHGRLQDFTSAAPYDLIVSNPPYFPDHLKAKDAQRNTALHTDELSFLDLISKAGELLQTGGGFWVILPPRQMLEFSAISENMGLNMVEKFTLQDKPGKRVQREICAFSSVNQAMEVRPIFIKDEDGNPHSSYAALVKGFLLDY
ncbi:methyltransferase [Algoriphagus halophytocola]|uniref:tRNA1(Val) (adenine(37)-N6)-methyltransferase n=1 Tax=Algoriphagus halophytocola TaxID=2991499 RepID=A0ABY6MC32_9BACT|nr:MULTISPECIES: methyltransferase [unclassified Algoriphagus]UZD21222.1 methyltransferase [Algoriphagus sp. TR-M5]WBL42433.1 methyltransferase [Algoriphagus sp. TR-M9]